MSDSSRSMRALVGLAAIGLAPLAVALPALAQAPVDETNGARPAGSAAPASSVVNVRGHSFGELDDATVQRRLTADAQVAGSGRGPRRAGAAKKRAVTADTPIVTMPGYETLGDGGSRLFVLVSKAVQVEERKAGTHLTYVLKGAHVLKRNNTNPLVTVHMNTPVASARLVPAGSDVQLVVELRAASAPTWRVAEAQGGSAVQIDFPSGTFVSGPAAAPKLGSELKTTTDGTVADEERDGQEGAVDARGVKAPTKLRRRPSGLPAPAAAPPIPR